VLALHDSIGELVVGAVADLPCEWSLALGGGGGGFFPFFAPNLAPPPRRLNPQAPAKWIALAALLDRTPSPPSAVALLKTFYRPGQVRLRRECGLTPQILGGGPLVDRLDGHFRLATR
jgi:hypothetical protein